MEGTMIVILALAIPVLLFPVAFVWYLNIGGIYAALRKTRKAGREERATVGAKT